MTDAPRHIEVAIPLPVFHTYTYKIQKNRLTFAFAGKRVLVPFGRRRVTGYILGESDATDYPNIKNILDIPDERPLFPPSMVPFFRWIADYYMHPIGEVIKGALPGNLNQVDQVIFNKADKGEKDIVEASLSPLQKDILNVLESGPGTLKKLCRTLEKKIPVSLMYTMEKKGWINKNRVLTGGTAKPVMEAYVSLIRSDIPRDRFFHHRKKIIDVLALRGTTATSELKLMVPDAVGYIHYLKEKGYISVSKKRVYRDPLGSPIEPDTPPVLTNEQQHVVTEIISSMGKGFSAFLLAGVTGSGKTEVYLRVTAEAVNKGFTVLVLVPEIALISQTERRFRARFGECIAVLHSNLSSGERYDQWTRIEQKKVRIVIGARSAIFAPVENIGIIIVDEEHDASYKQEGGLRYNARDIAVVRAKLDNTIALLGSATPSIQSSYNVSVNKFVELKLKNRVNKRPLPEITVIDLGKHRDKRGIRRFFSPELYQAMKETLDRGEQVLLFLNRRGFAGFPVCTACGETLKCKNCDISLTLHKNANAYKCHFCGFSMASVSTCRSCGSSSIKNLGLGTEKVEEALKKLFPDTITARLDRDTTTRKGSVLKILKNLKNNSTDILVGTQMVTKGHDFPNITLVGIICADLSLNFPDFRACERTFQLLAQVAGRAGRGSVPGRVIMQTYNPNHYSILAAKEHDYSAFFNKEINFRKALNYPPFSRMIQLKISGKDKTQTKNHAHIIGKICGRLLKRHTHFSKSIDILGPIEAPLLKIANHYRWQILLKGKDTVRLHEFVHQLIFKNMPKKNQSGNVRVVVDVDPFFMM